MTHQYTRVDNQNIVDKHKQEKQHFFDLVLSIIGLSGATLTAYAIDIVNGGTGLGTVLLYPAALCMITRISPKTQTKRNKIINVGSSVPV